MFSLLAASCFLLPASLHAHATTLTASNLVKGSTDGVYYVALGGVRFVFPNAKTYFTWYTDFSTVKTITADELANIPMGGNVTYRPGVKLVKITTNPKVYAVAGNGVLRWVKTEEVAKTLYGVDWNKKVDDIPDTFFVNYTVGADITSTADFSPSLETLTARDITVDKRIFPRIAPQLRPTSTTTQATTTSTPTTTATTTSPLTFSVSKTTAQAGDVLTLIASYEGKIPLSKFELFFNGQLVKTCTAASCSSEAVVPLSGTQPKYVAESRVTLQTNEVLSKTMEIQIQSDGSNLVQIQVGQSIIASGQAASAIAEADPSIAVSRIDISVDGTFVKGCATGSRQCQWSDYLSGANSSSHPVFAKVLDTLGRVYTSKTINITIGTNDQPGVKVLPALSKIYVGETVEVTVTATDADGVASIELLHNGTLLKKCDSAQPCTARTGPWNSVGTVSFDGRATDVKGNVGTSTDPGTIQVTR